MTSRIAIIGAGIGGLSASIRLAAKGHTVDLYEKNAEVGGKLWRYENAGYSFSYGPSTLTMPWLFHDLLDVAECPSSLLPYQRLRLHHRNHFADGSVLDAVPDREQMQDNLATLSAADARAWPLYLAETKRMYELSQSHFFNNSFSSIRHYLHRGLPSALARVHPLLPMQSFHARYFQDKRVRMSLDRYATYVGSSPAQTPATIALIAHIEFGTGVYYLPGGSATLLDALLQAAVKVGVNVHTNSPVDRVLQRHRSLTGIRVRGENVPYDAVVIGFDALTAETLFDRPLPALPVQAVSHSGLVALLGVRREYPDLPHHSVFFPQTYEAEFQALFRDQKVPENPTIYICNPAASDATLSNHGRTSLFVLINAPSSSDNSEWATDDMKERILQQLERRCHLSDLRQNLDLCQWVTPVDLARRTGAYRGSIYGPSSNGTRRALMRTPMVSRHCRGVFYVGGSTHPGGGTPMVAIGAKLAAEVVHAYSERRH